MYIDLHVHSVKSDGRYNVKQVIDMALQNNVSVLAFAEHYNISSYKIAKEISKGRIEIIPSVELGTDLTKLGYAKEKKCHILVYYPNNHKLYKILNQYEDAREKYVRKMIAHLNSIGIGLKEEEIKKYSRNPKSIGRYDLAKVLIKKGIAKDVDDAYDVYLSQINGEIIKRTKPSPIEVLQQISKMGGVPVLAHPASMRIVHNHGIITNEKKDEFIKLVKEFKKAGLRGIEVATSFTGIEATNFFKEVAEQLNLIITVGSDFHGRKNDIIEIGKGINNNLCIDDYSIIRDLKDEASKSYSTRFI